MSNKLNSLSDIIMTPSDFVAIFNQSLETAYPSVVIEGELTEFRIRKNQWVYFKIKDETAVIDCFATVYTLKQQLEDGMMVRIVAQPRLHSLYGFSLNVSAVNPVGEGAIRRAFELMKAKLDAEGLFEPSRKRLLPAYPLRIGLISSKEAAGAKDFITILQKRWPLAEVEFANVGVQGEAAINQIVSAIEYFDQLSLPVEILVVARGGGSAEDLMVFSSEPVVRAVASSRTPIVVAVGHEQDMSLADLAADVRAATPTQAAQIIAPDIADLKRDLDHKGKLLTEQIQFLVSGRVSDYKARLEHSLKNKLNFVEARIEGLGRTLSVLDPSAALRRGYAIIRAAEGELIRSIKTVKRGDIINAELVDGDLRAEVK